MKNKNISIPERVICGKMEKMKMEKIKLKITMSLVYLFLEIDFFFMIRNSSLSKK